MTPDPHLDPQRTITLALQDGRQSTRRAASVLAVAAGLDHEDERRQVVTRLHAALVDVVNELERLVRS